MARVLWDANKQPSASGRKQADASAPKHASAFDTGSYMLHVVPPSRPIDLHDDIGTRLQMRSDGVNDFDVTATATASTSSNTKVSSS